MARAHDPLTLPTYLAQLREIQQLATTALQAGTEAAAEAALDRIADISCEGHEDDAEDDADDDT